MRDNHDIIARMINEGHIVGNHSVNHPDFSTLSSDEIVSEIKGFDDYIRKNFGYSSMYFRYPQGKYSEYALAAVNDLGFKCVFWSLAYADWDLNAQKGAEYAKNTVMERIHPGAVILLHAVSPDNAAALGDIIDSCREMGYEFCSLEKLS
jgi:peptidoglycan-N-acetylmuramic acid deacetylase